MSNKYFFLVFLGIIIGIISQNIITSTTGLTIMPGLEQPIFSNKAPEKTSPSDTIKEENIRVYKNRVEIKLEDQTENEWLMVLNLKNVSWSRFTDTNSMDPVLDKEANAIRIKVPCEEIEVGDIISYKYEEGIIIHRIVHKEKDEKGTYFVTKGDNNPVSDPGKVRCEQVLGKVVAILY